MQRIELRRAQTRANEFVVPPKLLYIALGATLYLVVHLTPLGALLDGVILFGSLITYCIWAFRTDNDITLFEIGLMGIGLFICLLLMSCNIFLFLLAPLLLPR